MTFKPAHKHVGDEGKPGQIVSSPLAPETPRDERTLAEYIARKTDDFNYFPKPEFDLYNNANFRKAGKLVHQAEKLLEDIAMNKEQRYGWIKAWASGAGDGSE